MPGIGNCREVGPIRQLRKNQHIAIASTSPDGPGSTGFEDIHLLHDSIPELNLDEISLETEFLGKTLSCPILINALTGGTEQARRINFNLSLLAEKYGLAMAVGSQTVAIEDPGLRDTFRVARRNHPEGVIVANLSASSSVREALEAVEMIDADGLQLHFNVPQELAMGEGDRNFRGIIENVGQIVDSCPVPVIAKEVGFGFSRESVSRLYQTGVRIYDNGGRGGTNFLAIEAQRGGMFAGQFFDWGIPTAVSLAEIISLQLPLTVIASGGIRTPLDVLKALAMGADVAGISGLFLRVLVEEGMEELDRMLGQFLYQLKALVLMTGSQNCRQLRQKPIIITGKTSEWLKARNIKLRKINADNAD